MIQITNVRGGSALETCSFLFLFRVQVVPVSVTQWLAVIRERLHILMDADLWPHSLGREVDGTMGLLAWTEGAAHSIEKLLCCITVFLTKLTKPLGINSVGSQNIFCLCVCVLIRSVKISEFKWWENIFCVWSLMKRQNSNQQHVA